MNTKGTFFHWAVFGIIGAIGAFFILSSSFVQMHSLIGPWQLDVINTIHRSELDLLLFDLQARQVGWDIALDLASKGGFNGDSPCGVSGGINHWNNPREWCLPQIEEEVETSFTTRFLVQGVSLNHLTVEQSRVSALAGEKTILQRDPYYRNYTYDYSFTVNLGYSFDEYTVLFGEARKMVDFCRDAVDLPTCVVSQKPVHWHYQSCDQPETSFSGRIVSFCVESPTAQILLNQPVRYRLALDFTQI